MDLLVFPHIFDIALYFFIDWEISEIKVSIILDNILRISEAMQLFKGSIDLLLNFLVIFRILSLLLFPHCNSLSRLHVLQLCLLFDIVVIGLEPGVELVTVDAAVGLIWTDIPILHVC